MVYRNVVGNTSQYWVLTPMSKFAERDGENPYIKMTTEQEGAARGARLAQDIETVRIPFPPTWVRYIRVRVRPGTTGQLVASIKTDVAPAMKKLNAELRVRQTLFAGNVNEFTVAAGFEKWAVLDDAEALPKAMGEETFRKFEDKIHGIETNVEEYIFAYQKELSYYPGAVATGSR